MSDPAISIPALWLHCQPESETQIPMRRLRETTRIGRHPDCGVHIPSRYVSRYHAELYFDEGCWWIKDLNSSNGVYINSVKAMEARLTNQSVLKIGQRISFKVFIDRSP
jgi:Nif-specific regulatory protein